MAALAAPALAQQRPTANSAYSARTMPWPGTQLPTRPATIPGVPRPPELPRTIYYQKEAGPPVNEKAAGLLKPVGADEPLPQPKAPMPGGMIDARPEEMFRLESETPLLRRVIEDEKMRKDIRLEPDKEPVKAAFSARAFAPSSVIIEPNYVCYGRLIFEDKNTERYGWNFGPIQPFMSAADFFGRCQSLPYLVFSYPCNRYDCSAGHCLPGDPVPYLLYPPGLSLTGAAAQATIAVALSFIFP